MFDQQLDRTSSRGRGTAFVLALVAHAIGLALIVAGSLLAHEPPEAPAISVVFREAPPPPPPPRLKPAPAPAKPEPAPAPAKPRLTQPRPRPGPSTLRQEAPVKAQQDSVQLAALPRVALKTAVSSGELLAAAGGFRFAVASGLEGVAGGGVKGGVPGGVVGGNGDQPLPVDEDIEPPEVIRRVRPVYPAMARAAGVEGMVKLEAVIDTEGRVERVRMIQGHRLLEKAARQAIREYRFRPARRSGKPVKVFFRLEVLFALT